MPEYVRVRDTSGHEITVRSDLPEGHPRGVKVGQTVLDKPATKSRAPLAPKYRTALGQPLPGSKVAQKRSRRRPAAFTAPPEPVPAAEPQPATTQTSGHLADIPMED